MGIEVITINIQRYGKDLWVNKYIYQFCSQNEDFELNKRDDAEGGGNNRCDELPKEKSRMYE